MPLQVLAPVSGQLSSLEHAPDPIFSMGAVGWGAVIEPAREPGTVVAPVDGKLERVAPHVFSIACGNVAVMVQVGIGGESTGGRGYELHKKLGDEVRIGEPIVSWNPAELEAAGVTPMVLVIAIDRDEFALSKVRSSGSIAVGDVAFVIPK